MPFKNMPEAAFKIWGNVYNSAKDAGDSDEKAAKKAYGALKNAGWYKDEKTDKWVHKASLQEFSLRIERAGLDKPTGDLLWRMVASDTDVDSYNDSMSLELFEDFIARSKSEELVPEQFRSDFWCGGMPYLSISHYPDLNGEAVPGVVDAIYIDGNYFKAKGRYNKTKLGWACFEAVRADLYDPKRQDAEDKVRVSIAFLDWKHKHKSNGYLFERSTMDDICPECMKEMLEQLLEGKEPQGKEFLRGHLIHLAHTRVPVNKRTSVEVEKSMTTQLEDAKSIVGEELANELEEKAKAVTKSEALVIKSEETTPLTEETEIEEPVKVEVEPVEELSVTKKEADCAHPASHYLVVEEADKPSTWHLRVKSCSGEYDHRLMGAAWAALHEGYRGNKYEGPDKEAAIGKLKGIYKREGMDIPSKAELEFLFMDIKSEFKEALNEVMKKQEVVPHPLDAVLNEFKAEYDLVAKSDISLEDKLTKLQGHYQKFVDVVRESLTPAQTPEIAQSMAMEKTLSQVISALDAVAQRMELVVARLSAPQPTQAIPTITPPAPVQRSLTPSQFASMYPPASQAKSLTPTIRALVEQNVK